MHTIRHVNQLLALNDVPLVEALYGSLLQRKADPDELKFYVGQLRAGYGKAELIADFAASLEVSDGNAAISGLQQHVARQRKLGKSIWRLLGGGRQYQRQLNRLENSLGQVLHEIAGLKRETRQRLEAVEGRSSISPQSGSDANAEPKNHGESLALSPAQSTLEAADYPDRVDLSSESAAVRRIFSELAKEIESANNREPE